MIAPNNFDARYPMKHKHVLTGTAFSLIVLLGVTYFVSLSDSASSFFFDDISDIDSNSSLYHGKHVTIRGKVGLRLGILGSGFFELQDLKSGISIPVFTPTVIPESGTVLTVKGEVKQLASIADYQVVYVSQEGPQE